MRRFRVSSTSFAPALELATMLGTTLFDVLTFEFDLAARYLFESEHDTPADLGLVVSSRASLGVPVVDRLHFNTFVDAWVFRGKVPATRRVASSIVFGVELSYDRIFAL